MESFIKDSGWVGLDMDLECGVELKEIVMSGNGSLGKLMDMGCIYGSMEIGIKESLSKV